MAPPTPARLQDLIRHGAEQALDPPATWFGEVEHALFDSPVGRQIADDPDLTASARRAILSTLTAWVVANVRAPGAPVAPDSSEATVTFARDLVRRGWDDVTLDAYRAGQNVAWRHWMQIVFTLSDDPAELQELLDISTASISAYVGATIGAVSERMRRERAALPHDLDAARRETVALVLHGAPVTGARVEHRLGYRMHHDHHAAVVWTEDVDPDVEAVDRICESLAGAARADDTLTIRASTGTWWLWTSAAPDTDAATRAVASTTGIRVALAGPAAGVAGFRRSHLDALTTQRLLGHLAADRRIVHHDEVALVSLTTQDPDAAGRFVHTTLGGLATADPDLRSTMRAYLAHEGNVTRAAAATYTHRNTFQCSALVAKLSRTWPMPGSPYRRPGPSATRPRRSSTSAGSSPRSIARKSNHAKQVAGAGVQRTAGS